MSPLEQAWLAGARTVEENDATRNRCHGFGSAERVSTSGAPERTNVDARRQNGPDLVSDACDRVESSAARAEAVDVLAAALLRVIIEGRFARTGRVKRRGAGQ